MNIKLKMILTLAVLLSTMTDSLFANEVSEIGSKIYERAFGRGCGACHDIASNPQLTSLIKAGKLPKDQFSKVLKEGRNGMPKATNAIMEIGLVKKAGYSEDQAIDAVYEYLKK